jgi:hypothetical protein
LHGFALLSDSKLIASAIISQRLEPQRLEIPPEAAGKVQPCCAAKSLWISLDAIEIQQSDRIL